MIGSAKKKEKTVNGKMIFADLIATDFHKSIIEDGAELSYTFLEKTGKSTVAAALMTIFAKGSSMKPLENSAKTSFPQ